MSNTNNFSRGRSGRKNFDAPKDSQEQEEYTAGKEKKPIVHPMAIIYRKSYFLISKAIISGLETKPAPLSRDRIQELRQYEQESKARRDSLPQHGTISSPELPIVHSMTIIQRKSYFLISKAIISGSETKPAPLSQARIKELRQHEQESKARRSLLAQHGTTSSDLPVVADSIKIIRRK
jgi:hypothetical protein